MDWGAWSIVGDTSLSSVVPELQMLLLRTLEQYVHEGMDEETMPISSCSKVVPVVAAVVVAVVTAPCETASEPIESFSGHSSLSETVLKKGL
jgi:hypothetical protein